MKIKYIFSIAILFLSVMLSSCKDDPEPNPISLKIVITGEENWNEVVNGNYLKFNAIVDTEGSDIQEINIQMMECFLGNRKIASFSGAKCEVIYKIENAPTGIHELRIEATAVAPGYDKTLAVGYYDITVSN